MSWASGLTLNFFYLPPPSSCLVAAEGEIRHFLQRIECWFGEKIIEFISFRMENLYVYLLCSYRDVPPVLVQNAMDSWSHGGSPWSHGAHPGALVPAETLFNPLWFLLRASRNCPFNRIFSSFSYIKKTTWSLDLPEWLRATLGYAAAGVKLVIRLFSKTVTQPRGTGRTVCNVNFWYPRAEDGRVSQEASRQFPYVDLCLDFDLLHLGWAKNCGVVGPRGDKWL